MFIILNFRIQHNSQRAANKGFLLATLGEYWEEPNMMKSYKQIIFFDIMSWLHANVQNNLQHITKG